MIAVKAGKSKEPRDEITNQISVPKVSLPADSDDLTGKKYDKVVSTFHKAGFTNIRIVYLNDLSRMSPFSSGKEGRVSSISVNGKDTFSGGKKVAANTPILISIHNYRGKRTGDDEYDAPDVSDGYRGQPAPANITIVEKDPVESIANAAAIVASTKVAVSGGRKIAKDFTKSKLAKDLVKQIGKK